MKRQELTQRVIARFEKNFWKGEGCWLWQGGNLRDGYGLFSLNNRTLSAHRVAYCLEYGDFDETQNVLHSCDVTSCVSPSHLFLGNHSANMQDMHDKSRHPAQKLNSREVLELRQLYQSGNFSRKQLAEQFGVSVSNIEKIVNSKSRANS